MQAVKEKLQDMNEMRKAKAEAKAEEKAEKEIAKARMDIAHEVRMAREAEAEMDVHVNRAAEKADKATAKHAPSSTNQQNAYESMDSYGQPCPGAAATGTGSNACGHPLDTTRPIDPTKKML